MTGFTSSCVRTRSPIRTSEPPAPFVRAIQPPKPNGVGAARPAMVTRRSVRGMFTFKTPSLKSPFLPRAVRTAPYSAGTSWADAIRPPAIESAVRISAVANVRRVFMIPLGYGLMAPRRFIPLALAATCWLAASSPRRAAAAEPDPDVAATVTMVLTSARHPEMTWPELPDVVPTLKELYDAEPDRLLWFDGTQPAPGVANVVRGLALADEHGLRRADYDADRLLQQWISLRSGSPVAPAQRALFDLALTANVARLGAAVHRGRVDPATLRWGYKVVPRTIDPAKVLRDLRATGDLARLLGELQPPFTHYARAKTTLARYKKMAAAEPPLVPELAKGQKVEPGKPWAGVASLAARLRTLGDLGAPPTAVSDAAGPCIRVRSWKRSRASSAATASSPTASSGATRWPPST